ncbi:HTH-type transcriptional regulator with cupin domain [Gottschalkia acidurici 9a]|uniref:HTH-type transcriptional regulator with cupin domain n=1 Tax=Gottschalkia acidurici (strain ATCC 7906 / DSM 604 / BCRC 14475 / CIP 104303 / KCTC 5404 / NCIMB 10678 / 9a) TaxID=1128398 RepID=K0AYV4_GOTA9|nr:XRE family transcriptional regulator [Gottschalkia acidurici]AFS77967.1 HTH-type transcriptional regulator with cupin domain [Gottschalkia acidurici 9a]
MRIGEKIRRLRVKHSLTQEELANRCELTKGFISQVERDLTSPSIATLVDILDGLGTNLKDFFNEIQEEKIVFVKDDVFETENEELKYVLQWLIPNAQKNQMEPIMIELDGGGKSKEDYPHEGEEFGYVLSGNIYLYIGSQRYKVKKGESFYFKAHANHYIENAGKAKAKVLWVSTPPSF